MKTLILMAVVMMFAACTNDDAYLIEKGVTALVKQYPQATLQDIYKSFYQERFGPGHLIPNIDNARNYLKSELDQAAENTGTYYEPTGSEGKYIRVYLNAVSDGKISAEQLLDAFVESANHVPPRAASWADQWAFIVQVIENKQLPVTFSEELKLLLKTCSEKDEAVHHSPEYEAAYHPHYRIVERGIFESKLKELLK